MLCNKTTTENYTKTSLAIAFDIGRKVFSPVITMQEIRDSFDYCKYLVLDPYYTQSPECFIPTQFGQSRAFTFTWIIHNHDLQRVKQCCYNKTDPGTICKEK